MKTRIGFVVVSFLLSVAIGWSLSRGGDQSSGKSQDKNRPLIGLSLDTLKEARWQKDRDIFTQRANALGADVLVQSANSDDARQIQDVEALISRGVDALVIIPHDGAAMAKAVRLAHESGIPVMAYDRLITDCDLDLYLTFDNVKVGQLQAQYLLDHLPTPGKGRIVRIYGAPTDNNAKLFKQGQDIALRPYVDRGDIQVIHEDWAENWSPANAKKIANAALTRQGGSFDGVLVTNDGTAGGAIQALIEEGLAGKVLVTGQDADLAACQRIVAGTQSMTVYKPIENLARRGAELAVDLARRRPLFASDATFNGEREVPSVLLEVVAVTRDNLRETVIADGFHSEAEVYGN